MSCRMRGGKPRTRERNVMAAIQQVLLRPEKVVSLGTRPDMATSTASAEEGELLVRDLGAILGSEVGGLERMARSDGGQLV